MKRVKNPQVYMCDHCHKKVFGEKSCANHEARCKRNPANRHLCVRGCVHFAVEKAHVEDGCYMPTCFYCSMDGTPLRSYKRDGKPDEGCTRMPLECDNYEAHVEGVEWNS